MMNGDDGECKRDEKINDCEEETMKLTETVSSMHVSPSINTSLSDIKKSTKVYCSGHNGSVYRDPDMKRSSHYSNDIAEQFYDWKELFPELQIFVDNYNKIREEVENIGSWIPWPEDHFSDGGQADWTVFPFLHTFPALDDSKMTWLPTTCQKCPVIASLLQQIPNIRTALLSRLGSGTQVSCHTGWEDLANYVLRCHFCIIVPDNHECGLWVDRKIQFHKEKEIIVFDDSKIHRVYSLPMDSKDHNDDTEKEVEEKKKSLLNKNDRVVLIIDILRPSHIPLGTATGGHTEELDDFISKFR